MSDVVEQGGPERPPLPPWLRLLALAALAAVGVLLLSNGLLSADRPERAGPEPSPSVASTPSGRTATGEPPDTFERVFVVVRDGDRLVRYDEFGVSPGPDLPPGLPPAAELTVVDYPTGSEVLVTAAAGRLYRVDPLASQVTDVAAAAAVVGDATGTGNAFVVLEEQGVVVMDVRSGEVVDAQPFAAVPPRYTPVGALSLFGVEGLLVERRAGSGPELAVSWAADAVGPGARPSFQPLPGDGSLLGLTQEWVLRLRGTCPGPDCRLLVTGFAGTRPSAREVRPPDGWSFAPYPLGVLRGPLVPVVPLDPGVGDGPALARLAAGGDNALLVPSTTGLVPDAGIVEQHDGTVVFVRLGREGIRRAYAWTPDRAGEVTSGGSVPPLPRTARLVCLCT